MFDPFGPSGGMMQGRHSIKLMYLRKDLEGKLYKDEDSSEEKLGTFINGVGKGLKSTVNLQFWNKPTEDKKEDNEGWVTDEELEKGSKSLSNL